MKAVHVERDVLYSEIPGFRPLALDLYLPQQPACLTCIYLHGGGWRVGSRRLGPGPAAFWSPSFFEVVARFGIAVASVDYRLSGEARFPAQLEDVDAAAHFLKEHGGEYGLPSKLGVWGSSAGGHLAALYSFQSAEAGSGVHAAVCWYAPTDLDALSADRVAVGVEADRTSTSREGQLVGGDLDERRELVDAASPVKRVPSSPPPFLFLHGSVDVAVPPRQSERLAELLREAGGTALVELVAGVGHMFAGLDDSLIRAAVERSARFLLDPTC